MYLDNVASARVLSQPPRACCHRIFAARSTPHRHHQSVNTPANARARHLARTRRSSCTRAPHHNRGAGGKHGGKHGRYQSNSGASPSVSSYQAARRSIRHGGETAAIAAQNAARRRACSVAAWRQNSGSARISGINGAGAWRPYQRNSRSK